VSEATASRTVREVEDVLIRSGKFSLPSKRALYSSYIKRNDTRLRDVPVYEKYLNRDPRRTKLENLKTLIHIPIV
jgi:AraC family transcriptional regulator